MANAEGDEVMNEASRLVAEQAEDEGLWFEAQTASEAYLQAALRALHAAVERDASVAQVRPLPDPGPWPATGLEPRGCPTPGACSCPVPTPLPDEKLLALADRIDHEQLWRRSALEHFDWPQDQQDRLFAGIELRRYASLLGQDCWTIFPPKGGVSFSSSVFAKAVEMAGKEAKRRGEGVPPLPGAVVNEWMTTHSVPDAAPIDMVLHCPACGMQHIDAVEPINADESCGVPQTWLNPPHRSHLCHGCGHIWRPADVATNGVRAIKTQGRKDSPIVSPKPLPDAAQKAMRMALAALDESLDDVANGLEKYTHGAGYPSYDRRIKQYREQIERHKAAIDALCAQLEAK
jgi:hypothetical protein